jgi:hypothetical protein
MSVTLRICYGFFSQILQIVSKSSRIYAKSLIWPQKCTNSATSMSCLTGDLSHNGNVDFLSITRKYRVRTHTASADPNEMGMVQLAILALPPLGS